jgi:coenzyme F420-dependent glucose-6-phosphate dehydrogenase
VLKLGYKASAEQFGPAELLHFATIAETCRFDSVFISDHFQPWRHTHGHAPFSIAWLGALGARTSQIIMGTSVLAPTLRYHPSVVAQAFGTLGALFPGRLILGLGTGESLNEVPATGAAFPPMKERFARLREAVTLIRQLWSQERVTFSGEYYTTRQATIYDRPPEMIPIYVAAAGPMVAKYAGRVGDGFICTSGKPIPLYRDTLLPNVEAGLAASGRSGSAFDRMIEMKVSFDTRIERALNDTSNWAALALPAEKKLSIDDPLEMEKLADAVPIEQAASRWIVSSDPDEHVEKIAAYVKMGFSHLVFHAPGNDQERFLRLYADQVMPKLRNLS